MNRDTVPRFASYQVGRRDAIQQDDAASALFIGDLTVLCTKSFYGTQRRGGRSRQLNDNSFG